VIDHVAEFPDFVTVSFRLDTLKKKLEKDGFANFAHPCPEICMFTARKLMKLVQVDTTNSDHFHCGLLRLLAILVL